MEIETAMAKAFLSRTELRDPEKTLPHLHRRRFPEAHAELRLERVFQRHRHRPIRHAECGHARLSSRRSTVLIASEPLDAWKSYLRWHVLHGQAAHLSKPFFDENFAFFSQTLAGQKEPSRAGGSAPRRPIGALGEAVGQDWVKAELSARSQAEHGQAGRRARKGARATTSRRCPG